MSGLAVQRCPSVRQPLPPSLPRPATRGRSTGARCERRALLAAVSQSSFAEWCPTRTTWLTPRKYARKHRQPQPIVGSFITTTVYFGLPSTIARPLRWQRSDGSSSVTNGGRQRGTKLDSASSVARQEKRVLTNQSWPPAP